MMNTIVTTAVVYSRVFSGQIGVTDPDIIQDNIVMPVKHCDEF